MPASESRSPSRAVFAPITASPNCSRLHEPFGSRSPGSPVVPLDRWSVVPRRSGTKSSGLCRRQFEACQSGEPHTACGSSPLSATVFSRMACNTGSNKFTGALYAAA
ncbi:hypothetical protein Ari01nite_51000 [Paractinoplanes rishiriensis]|uniref:Uncharacterized protein n=1 Tax=Paractinoplanes rishiriensis TaxID=1050105 RepID=A0A919JZ80_9ACTN|nr:hypothetical protein Ari01nite_51000 [Actinoplanes rishiriensis]